MRLQKIIASGRSGFRAHNRTVSRGFTLIEVLAATTVTVFGLIAAFYLVGLGTTINSDARNTSMAYQACQQEIEVLRNMPYATLKPIVRATTANGTLESRFLTASGADDASRPADAGYPGQVANLANLRAGSGGVIITNDATAGEQAKHVTVVVRWTDPGNRVRSAVVGTIIAQGGMGAR